jgi:hypothetical protein
MAIESFLIQVELSGKGVGLGGAKMEKKAEKCGFHFHFYATIGK